MAGVAEVGRAEAEVDGHRTAVATLVLQEICSVFGTHLEHGQTDSLYTLKLLHIYAHLSSTFLASIAHLKMPCTLPVKKN